MCSRFWMELWKRILMLLFFSTFVEENDRINGRGDDFETVSTKYES